MRTGPGTHVHQCGQHGRARVFSARSGHEDERTGPSCGPSPAAVPAAGPPESPLTSTRAPEHGPDPEASRSAEACTPAHPRDGDHHPQEEAASCALAAALRGQLASGCAQQPPDAQQPQTGARTGATVKTRGRPRLLTYSDRIGFRAAPAAVAPLVLCVRVGGRRPERARPDPPAGQPER